MSVVAPIVPLPALTASSLLPSPSPSPVMEADVAMEEMKEPSSQHTAASPSPPPSSLAPPVSSSSSSSSSSPSPSPSASPDHDVEMKTACSDNAASGSLISSQTLSNTKSDGATYNAFGHIVNRPYNDPALENEGLKVRWIYRAVNFLTDLFFGVDKDLDHLPEKRKSMQPVERTGKDILHSQTLSVLPPDISAGYGELAWQGFDKLLYWLQHEAPENYRLNEKSRFLDIGSGFGKCVFHAKIRAKVARSVGIECIKTRHEKALESLHLLRAGFVPGLSDAKDAPSFEVRNIDSQLNGCELFEGDISVPRFHPLVYGCTHVYAFDVVFSKDTHAKILPIVEASKCQIFGCYLNPMKLALFGCTKFQLLHSIKVKTTGKQSFTCFFYAHKDRMEGNVPAASDNSNTLDLDPESDAFWEAMHAEAAKPEAYVVEALSARNNPQPPPAPAAAAASSSSSTSDSAQSPDESSNTPSSHKKSTKKKSKAASPQKEKSDSTPKKIKKTNEESNSESEGEEEPKSKSKSKKKAADASPSTSKKKSKKEEEKEEDEKPKKSHKKKQKSEAEEENEEPVVAKKSHKKKVPQSQEKGTKRKSEEAEDVKKGKASSHKKKQPEESGTKEEVKAPAVKKISRAREFELAMAAAFAAKPKSTGRSTNNSVMVKLEPVKVLPKDLDDYLLNPVKPEKPLIPEDQAAAEAVDESPSKKQKLEDGSASASR